MTKKNVDKVKQWVHKLDGVDPMQHDAWKIFEMHLSDEAYNAVVNELEAKIELKRPEINKEIELALIRIANNLPEGNDYKEAIKNIKK